ncbi:MAG: nucleoside-diphosphate sugar epimerase/dehydratase [Nitrospirota bacterium]
MGQGRSPRTGRSSRVLDSFLHLPSSFRRLLVTGVFLFELAIATFLAFYVRFDGAVGEPLAQVGTRALIAAGAPFFLFYFLFGAHRGLWAFSSIHDFIKISAVALAGGTGSYAVVHHAIGWFYPRSIFILTASFLFILMSLNRGGIRLFQQWARSRGKERIPVVIVGAGRAGEMLVRDMQHSADYAYRPVAFIDRDLSKAGSTIHGIPVVGDHRAWPKVIKRYGPQELIIAIPSASPAAMRNIVKECEPSGLPIKVLPSVRAILHGHVTVNSIRPLALVDLLSREPVPSDGNGLESLIRGKRVLVTGAGGSIGSELCRQIAVHAPDRLVLVERYENNLHAVSNALADLKLVEPINVRACLADVLDGERMEQIFAEHRPDLVFHAAAHKHVPIVEENPCEGALNNVIGTHRIATLAKAFAVERMILISTDKAVNPTNVMGATKRFAEYIVRSFSGEDRTRFITVRFGNVLGSNGSVVPRFQEQIHRGGPVTVTHPQIERYFMLIPEAVNLVLEAARRGEGGEVFVLDMGDPIKIVDLAHNMIRLAGYVPNEDIAVTFSGLRPGEKLFEELFDKEERVEPTSHPKLRKAVLSSVWAEHEVEEAMNALSSAIRSRDGSTLKETFQHLIPSYRPDNATVSEPARNGAANGAVREIDTEVLPPLVVSNGSVDETRRARSGS